MPEEPGVLPPCGLPPAAQHFQESSISEAIAVTPLTDPKSQTASLILPAYNSKRRIPRSKGRFLMHGLRLRFRARHRAGHREPAWECQVDAAQRTAGTGENQNFVSAFVQLAVPPLRACDDYADGNENRQTDPPSRCTSKSPTLPAGVFPPCPQPPRSTSCGLAPGPASSFWMFSVVCPPGT